MNKHGPRRQRVVVPAENRLSRFIFNACILLLGIGALYLLAVVASNVASYYQNRVSEPAPVTAEWTDGFGSGVQINMSLENVAYECGLGKDVLEQMKERNYTWTPFSQPDHLPTTVRLVVDIPDGRKAYLEYWVDVNEWGELEVKFPDCEVR